MISVPFGRSTLKTLSPACSVLTGDSLVNITAVCIEHHPIADYAPFDNTILADNHVSSENTFLDDRTLSNSTPSMSKTRSRDARAPTTHDGPRTASLTSPSTCAEEDDNTPCSSTKLSGYVKGSSSYRSMSVDWAFNNSNGWPTSNQTPSIACAYMGQPISSRWGNNCLLKSNFSPTGM